MALSAFTARLGRGQGRIPSSEAPDGDFVFVLGDVETGRFFSLAAGDHTQLVQNTDLTRVLFVRARLRLHVPLSTPSELAWEASILVDGEKAAWMRAKAGRQRIADLAANVSKLDGMHTVGVRLELVGA